MKVRNVGWRENEEGWRLGKEREEQKGFEWLLVGFE